MFEISDFYRYCKNNDVDVIPYEGCPQPGATVRDNGFYAVFLDFTKIRSTKLLRGVCFHELGHIATGALHKVDSPYELVERSEYRATRWCVENYLTEEAFRTAFAAGYTELWQLSEYFDLPEKSIQDALTYWKERKGIDFTK
ncbi:MAG: ImmA/IrrE family metallo-endopeptidase [Ruminococcaceae bacterium]|nr:ImmA/IrrE family metallo-endopeptidase [Oscillospiraceae bacterium]